MNPVTPLLVPLLACAVFAYPIYRLLLSMRARQTISPHVPEHLKKQGTPTMGGLMFLPGFVALAAMGQVPAAIPVALLGFMAIGFLDDFLVPRFWSGTRGLGWKQKILLQLGVAAIVAWMLRGSYPDLSLGLTVFLILLFVNAYNFADGMDGLAGSIGLGFAGGLLALAAAAGWSGAVPATAWCAIATLIPFLFFNAPPAKVFMGDVGSMPIGAAFGIGASMLLMPSPQSASPLAMPVALAILSVVLLVELIPGPLQIASVKLRKKKLFPMTPIHHAFEQAGIPETRVVWWYGLTQAVCAALAIGAYFALTHGTL